MAGATDLDLALAVALAEASDGYSDDDFKPSTRQVELRQQSLFLKCRNVPLTKSTRASQKKRQKTQLQHTVAGADQRKDSDAPKDGLIPGHKLQRNGRKDVKNRTNQRTLREVDVEYVQRCAKADPSVPSTTRGNLFDSFKYNVPQCQDIEQSICELEELEEGSSVAKIQHVFESVINENNISTAKKPEDEGITVTTIVGSPDDNKDQEELIGDNCISLVDTSESEEVIGLDEESQFSALLRLCTEESKDKERSIGDPDFSVVESGVGSQGSGQRCSQLDDVAVASVQIITEAHATSLDEGLDDISYLMTQQRVLQPAEIEPCAEKCIVALEVSNDQSRRSKGIADHEGTISKTDSVHVNIICPICEYDLSEISLELRVKHTEMCLNRIDESEVCLKDHTSEEVHPISCDLSLSFGCEKVKQWLERLNLSKYLDFFNQHEIDWDTLQWLTDEDLQLIGVTCLGPRRKILGALQDLKPGGTGKSTNSSVPPASRMEDDTSGNAQTSGKDSIKLITNFFPVTTGTRGKCVTNVVKQSIVVSKHGRTSSRMASSRPRISYRPNVRGVPTWMCIPGTPFRVDAFQHLSGDCSHWFLTHFHTDHYQGLTRGFRYGRIFCSAITARLVNLRIGVSWDRLMIVPLNEKYKICGVDVTFIDANHCPGSVMILFEPPNGEAVLHTGDFRFCSAMADTAVLQSTTVHTLILDTTYCDPLYDFPKQESVIQFVIDAIQAEAFNRDTLFLIGTYTIGKERVFLEVGKVLQKKIYVGSAKMKLLECMDLSAEDRKWLTSNEQESFIHVVPLWSISSFKRMNSISRHYHGRYKVLVAFSPTGWSFGRGKKKTPGKRHQQGTMIRYEVPYSEHSSFCELKEFVKFIAPVDIIPSVPGKSGTGADDMIASLWSEGQ